jgi:ribosomal protein S18 acetylase RimI-like enzyme
MTIRIRNAASEDINSIMDLDHSFETERVWQMELEPVATMMGARFRSTRLPRPMKVNYPRNLENLAKDWKKQAAILVADHEKEFVGYIVISSQIAPNSAWITNWAVPAFKRRSGIGTQLLLAAQKWAQEKGFTKINLEMQSKNMAAVRLAQKMAFEFSGYSDRYYENQDITLFFTKKLV